MASVLYVLFFISGAAALIFEMLWFRQAGLALGNSVWASSLVLAGFMGGLALGNALAARYGARTPNPVRAYAVAETAIAVTGVGLVFLLPRLGALLAPWLRPLLDHAWLLNPVRLGLAFLLLLVPSTAMGITLPLLTKALAVRGLAFGPALGRLYGWNTAGAVVGVVACEVYLIRALGVHGAAILAGALSLGAAGIAAAIARVPVPDDVPAPATKTPRRRPASVTAAPGPWLTAAFLSGFCLLALEVVWFRFLLLFVKGHSVALALILALVLTGIALGGLLAAWWLRVSPAAHRFAALVAFFSGVALIVSYRLFPPLIGDSPALVVETAAILTLGAPLILPVSLCSGMFFTMSGAAVQTALRAETTATGTLTLVNTTGAAIGALAAGLIFLPVLGVERSLLLIALFYGATGLLLMLRTAQSRPTAYAGIAALLLCLTIFPFGSMETHLVPAAVARWFPGDGSARTVAVREGLTETVVYVERQMLGRPQSYAMLTNAFSMSATSYGARRYMKLYLYWPMAVHPNLKHALLIGYGVGNTAKAMVDSSSLETIDVVDLSRDILELNTVVYPDPAQHPLRDPRIRVHIEDGRYLLQTTEQRFDLITGEPPPPGIAGVEHLYSREYFTLMRERLAEGGMVTYWLPLSDLSDVSAGAILRAFCDAFTDCSLWNGSGEHLMMVGTRDAPGGVSEQDFARQWRDPRVAAEMRRLGLEQPEQLGALFIGDADYVRSLTGGAAALTDDRPKLIDAPFSSPDAQQRLLLSVTDTTAARARFERSPFIARLWPAAMRTASLPYFEVQDAINSHMYGNLLQRPDAIHEVHRLLTATTLSTPVLWRLGSNSDIQQVLDTATPEELADSFLQFHSGIRLLSERRYAAAAEAFDRAETMTERVSAPRAVSTGDNAFALHMYALCMAGECGHAQALIREPWLQSLRDRGVKPESMASAPLPPFWTWMKETFGIDPRLTSEATPGNSGHVAPPL
jgi:predicted membrane-bound spermidine synthase